MNELNNDFVTIDQFQKIGFHPSKNFVGHIAIYRANGNEYLLSSESLDRNVGIAFIAYSIFRNALGRNYSPQMFLVSTNEKEYPESRWLLATEWVSNTRSLKKITFPECCKKFKGMSKLHALSVFLGVKEFQSDYILLKPESSFFQSMIVKCGSHFENSFTSLSQISEQLIQEYNSINKVVQQCYHFKIKGIVKALKQFSNLKQDFLKALEQELKPVMDEGYLKHVFEKIKLLQAKAKEFLLDLAIPSPSFIPYQAVYALNKVDIPKNLLCEVRLISDLFENGLWKPFQTFSHSFLCYLKNGHRWNSNLCRFIEIGAFVENGNAFFKDWNEMHFRGEDFKNTQMALIARNELVGKLKFAFYNASATDQPSFNTTPLYQYLASEERLQNVKEDSKNDALLLIDFLRNFDFPSEFFEGILKEIRSAFLTRFDGLPNSKPYLHHCFLSTGSASGNDEALDHLIFFRNLIQISDPNILDHIDQLMAPLVKKYVRQRAFIITLLGKTLNGCSGSIVLAVLKLLNILSILDPQKDLFDFLEALESTFIPHFIIPFATLYENSFTSSNINLIGRIYLLAQKMANQELKVKEHFYDNHGYNASRKNTLSVWSYFSTCGISENLLWNSNFTLQKLVKNMALLHKLVEISKQKIHYKTDTFKSLCFFIPRANPDFKISNSETLELALEMLSKCHSKKDICKALLFLDIYSPYEAKRLFAIYLSLRSRHPKGSSELLSINYDSFKKLGIQDQENWNFYLSRMRIPNIRILNWVLRYKQDHEKMIIDALDCLAMTHQTLNPKKYRILEDLILKQTNLAVKQAAVHCLHSTLQDTTNIHVKKFIYEILQQSLDAYNPTYNDSICTLLRCFSQCQFDEKEDHEILSQFLVLMNHDRIKNTPEIVYESVLCGLGIVANGKKIERKTFFENHTFDIILHELNKIIESTLWKNFDSHYGLDHRFDIHAKETDVSHLAYPIRADFEFNHRRMSLAILDLWVELHKNLINPTKNSLAKIYLDQVTDFTPYIPFLAFPENSFLYRGIGSKQGKNICQKAVLNVLTSGCYPRELHTAKHTNSNWSKRKEHLCGTFLTPYVELATTPLYYDFEDGALIQVKSEAINANRLAMNLRVEKEGRYNVVCFGGKSRQDFHQIILSFSWKSSLDLLAGENGDKKLKILTTQYDRLEATQSIERKRLKKQIYLLLEGILNQFKEDSSTYKDIFLTLTVKQLWEIHRSLVKDNFYQKHVIFMDKNFLSFLPQDTVENIHSETQHRLECIAHLRIEFMQKFAKPFCLGHAEILALPHAHFNQYVEKMTESLAASPISSNQIFSFSSAENLQYFSAQIAIYLREDEFLVPEFIKIFRIAFFCKKLSPSTLMQAFKNPSFDSYFGFFDNPDSSKHLIYSLVRLHHIYQNDSSEKEKELYFQNACNLLITSHSVFKDKASLIVSIFTEL